MRTTPIEPGFTFDYFGALVDDLVGGKKRSAKALLTQDQIIRVWGMRSLRTSCTGPSFIPGIPSLTERRAETSTVPGHRRHGRRGNREGRTVRRNRPVRQSGWIHSHHGQERGRASLSWMRGRGREDQYLGGACYLCPTCQE